jgi:hypothetical protein
MFFIAEIKIYLINVPKKHQTINKTIKSMEINSNNQKNTISGNKEGHIYVLTCTNRQP